ncbi:MAG: HD-GYP domain-containing protein [Actinomycetota bacterium]
MMLWRSEVISAVTTFTAFIIVTELLDTELPSRRRLRLSLAPALAFSMLEGARFGPKATPIAAGTFLAAATAAAIIRVASGREIHLRAIISSLAIVSASCASYGALRNVGPSRLLVNASRSAAYPASIVGLVCVLAIALILDPIASIMTSSSWSRAARSSEFVRSIFAGASLQAAVVSVAALVALAFPKLNWWSFPLFLGPLAATRYAFRQISAIRATELETLRALSKIPELAGYTAPGHSRRVAELSTAIAADLGVDEERRREIEYAALLHDIGRVVLEDPGAERATPNRARRDIAATGANIVATAGTFPHVAEMIREQDEPYRRRGQGTNEDVSLGSRILKVANTYDDLTHPHAARKESVDALERIHMGKAYDFDPEVVASLVRVLEQSKF